jgi:hypothetical protein
VNNTIDKIFSKLAEISIVPIRNTVMVLPCSAELVIYQLKKHTIKPSEHPINRHQPIGDKLFSGSINNNNFTISRILRTQNVFIPVVKGEIETSRKGSIIFLNFNMLKSPIILLVFWTILCILLAVFFFFVQNMPYFAIFSLFFVFFNYTVAMLNFNKEVEHTKHLLQQIFNNIPVYDN